MTRHSRFKFRTPVRPGRGAFTLTELLVVIGIIVLVLAFSIPMFNIMSGERSIEGGQNVVSAMLQRARARAIAVQEKRGVLFFEEPATGQSTVALVKIVTHVGTANVVELDIDADDVQTLPKGVGIAGLIPSVTPLRYQPRGLVVFDGLGRTEVMNYVIKNATGDNGLEITRRFDLPGSGGLPMISVNAMATYDKAVFPRGPNDQPTEFDTSQIDWLDKNASILVMNRYNGTLIRGE